MRAFLTILSDSILLLRARALFWISIGISLLVALTYLSIGFDEKGMSILFGAYHFEEAFLAKGTEGAELVYLGLFSRFIVGAWLSWVAIVIALVACAPIFPEFLAEGSAGVSLSKPISRPRLFFYKFTGALLFIGIQGLLFAAIVFIAIRWRLGVWNPTVFWSVPVLVLVFSYLYSIMVLLGIKTRSVMASVLLTMLIWAACFGSALTEDTAHLSAESGRSPLTGMPVSEEEASSWKTAYQWLRIPYSILPKPGQTASLLNRWIVVKDGRPLESATFDAMADRRGGFGMDEEMKNHIERHSPAWIIGSSLAFEAVILSLACWMFSRRDF